MQNKGIKQKVAEALKTLGEQTSWRDADRYLTKKYGRDRAGITSANFYSARSEIRVRGGLTRFLASLNGTSSLPTTPKPVHTHEEKKMQPTIISEPAPLVQTEVVTKTTIVPDVTLEDVKAVAAFLKMMGGKEKVERAVQILQELRK